MAAGGAAHPRAGSGGVSLAPDVDRREGTIGVPFVTVALVLSVLVGVTLCFVLPVWAAAVSESVVPAGAVSIDRVSLQPQPGWEEMPGDSPDTRYLTKDDVVLAFTLRPVTTATTPTVSLDELVAGLGMVPESEPVPFETATDDPGVEVRAVGPDDVAVAATVLARDGSYVVPVSAVGDPVAVAALTGEIDDMVLGIRIRKPS